MKRFLSVSMAFLPLLALICISIEVFLPQTTQAWSHPNGTCNNTFYNTDTNLPLWLGHIHDFDSNFNAATYSFIIANFAYTQYIPGHQSNDLVMHYSPPTSYTSPVNGFTGSGDDAMGYLHTMVGTHYFLLHTDGTITNEDDYYGVPTTNSPDFYNGYSTVNYPCVSFVGNMAFDSSFTDNHFPIYSGATDYTGNLDVTLAGATATFSIAAISPTPSSYIIHYGDGTDGTSLSHTYSSAGDKTASITLTPASSSDDLSVGFTIQPPPGNLHVQGDVSGYQVAMTTTEMLGASNPVTKIEYDFTSGNGSAYVDYAVTQSSDVSYYSNAGYLIDCSSVVNEVHECDNQIQYQYSNTVKTKKIYVRTTDSSGYIKTMTLDIQLGTVTTSTFINDNTLEAQAAAQNAPVVCGAWDIPCYIGQFLKSLWDGFTSLLQTLFVPSTSSIESTFTTFTTDTHGLSAVIVAPISTIATITTGVCTPISLPLPFVSGSIVLPCMTTIYTNYFGDFFILYQVITTGVVAYYVMVNLFIHVKNFKSPRRDQIEVLKL